MVNRIVVGFFRTNSYIYTTNKKTAFIIDPGAEPEKIITTLGRMNLTPHAILCTHGHLDHVSAISELVEHYKKLDIAIDLYIHEEDKEALGIRSLDYHKKSFGTLGVQGHYFLKSLYEAFPEPTHFLKDGEEVPESHLRVLHTPGHTPGSICLYSEKFGLVFSGDTLFFKGMGRTDLPGGNTQAIQRSIQEKLMQLPRETAVYPGHGPATTIEREEHNPFI